MSDAIERVLIGYGSESGNARMLARQLGGQPFLQPFAPQVVELNEILSLAPGERDLLLIISSSFGDGEPPASAELFAAQCVTLPAGLRYAIFGLGDTAYPRFCGFTKALDVQMAGLGGRALINRVDADANFEIFFARWLPVLEQVLAGDEQAGRDLLLQVTAYGEDHAFAAPILERKRLSAGAPYAWHIRLGIASSGMVYRAGDTIWLLPENDAELPELLSAWFGAGPDAAAALQRRELRLLSKSVLRELARLSGSDHLKALLKSSQRKALDAYLYGADLLDVLEDFCTPQAALLEKLLEILPPCMPRAYSIASGADDAIVDLCVREVCYERGGRLRNGVATGWLLGHRGPVRIFSRANPGFYLPREQDLPLLMIGTGTGIAPLIALLRELAAGGERRETCLVFGEKSRAGDFLYRDELEAYCTGGVLSRLITAFSRDNLSKYYVQHAIAEEAGYLADMLRRGAHIYLCGNRLHLEKAVESALVAVCSAAGLPSEGLWQTLTQQGRLHLELY